MASFVRVEIDPCAEPRHPRLAGKSRDVGDERYARMLALAHLAAGEVFRRSGAIWPIVTDPFMCGDGV
jgi:hypothetical protein